MPDHKDASDNFIHQSHNFEYANAAARTGATGIVAADVGKIARQTDQETFWVLIDDSPLTWEEITRHSTKTVSAAGSTETLDLQEARTFDITLDQACTFTFSNPLPSGRVSSFTLIMRQNGTGGYAPTWPGSVDWPGATEPTWSTGPNDVDVATFLTVDGGTTWLGFLAGADLS